MNNKKDKILLYELLEKNKKESFKNGYYAGITIMTIINIIILMSR